MPGLAAGAPLRAMAGVTAIWILARVLSWNGAVHAPWASPHPIVGSARHQQLGAQPPQADISSRDHDGTRPPKDPRLSLRKVDDPALHGREPAAASTAPTGFSPWQGRAAGGNYVLKASFRLDRPAAAAQPPRLPPIPYPRSLRPDRRLSAYLWIYLRPDRSPAGSNDAGAIANGQYGRSQAGALLSYSLRDAPGPQIAIYGRASAALDPWSQKEIALGMRVQPVPEVPVALHAEQRFDVESGKAAGTALYATGGSGPHPILGRLALETYAQAGYVLGRDNSYFFDASASVQRPIVELDRKTLSAGVGLWTGGQRGITRLDLGPSVNLKLPLRSGLARISVDGRVRIAGNARPESGAALTISTSF
ncbi:hypothetical protein [Parasphingorhabdus sp.]|uniref:hypothetical protein n=1 Tax=Parasphingorhabdus sp. TaxID=2709688 RepID=UPI0030032138